MASAKLFYWILLLSVLFVVSIHDSLPPGFLCVWHSCFCCRDYKWVSRKSKPVFSLFETIHRQFLRQCLSIDVAHLPIHQIRRFFIWVIIFQVLIYWCGTVNLHWFSFPFAAFRHPSTIPVLLLYSSDMLPWQSWCWEKFNRIKFIYLDAFVAEVFECMW